MITTTTLAFTSHGVHCAGWLARPDGPGPHPALVLAHGFGANHTVSLQTYEQHFAAAGIATLAFDYRHLGASDGEPRQRLSLYRHRQDLVAALDHVRGLPEIDAARVGLWGTSLGAMHVLRVAADRPDVAAVVVQCPIVDGPASLAKLGPAPVLRLTPKIIADGFHRAVGATPSYVPIVGPPGTVAAVTVAGVLRQPGRRLRRAADRGHLRQTLGQTDPRAAAGLRLAPRDADRPAPRGGRRPARAPWPGAALRRDHFAIYHPPLVAALLADQTAFLREHLDVA
jgi:pimeloyl-ACP methyl ester carboxylesterase